MTEPLGIDLFCGAGGCTAGYEDAGFRMLGVDLHEQKNYPSQFIREDAIAVLCQLINGLRVAGRGIEDVSFIHASPPCQAYSDLQKQSKISYPAFIPRLRGLLELTGLPYVIENVEGAPLENPTVLCGTMFPGLRVIRHRLFETNWPLTAPEHPKHPLVFTHDKRKAHYGRLDQDASFVQVTGGGNATVANKAAAMGIDWMTGRELNEAIPPSYTAYVGAQLMQHLQRRAAA